MHSEIDRIKHAETHTDGETLLERTPWLSNGIEYSKSSEWIKIVKRLSLHAIFKPGALLIPARP